MWRSISTITPDSCNTVKIVNCETVMATKINEMVVRHFINVNIISSTASTGKKNAQHTHTLHHGLICDKRIFMFHYNNYIKWMGNYLKFGSL